jgi:hypothetical protein
MAGLVNTYVCVGVGAGLTTGWVCHSTAPGSAAPSRRLPVCLGAGLVVAITWPVLLPLAVFDACRSPKP